uniref:Uncharacterized protein n=1 Tax=Plectus sambesii TaxID=2011161 RepID=A0A914UVQ7_9BILA
MRHEGVPFSRVLKLTRKHHIILMRNEGAALSGDVVNTVIRVYLEKNDLARYRLEDEALLSNRSLSQSILRRMGFVRRKGTKAAKKLPGDFEILRTNYLA